MDQRVSVNAVTPNVEPPARHLPALAIFTGMSALIRNANPADVFVTDIYQNRPDGRGVGATRPTRARGINC